MKTNYFELLAIKQSYKIDSSLIKQQYLLMQQTYHPDRISDIKLQKEYIEKSMLINEAYKILNDDCKRAEHLLILNGYEFNDQNLKNQLKVEELEKILSQHEIIDEMEDLTNLQKIYDEKIQEKSRLMDKLNKYFDLGSFAEALDLTIRLKYLTNLITTIKSKIRHADN